MITRKGFTLVELTVVIVVLLAFIAILLPSLDRRYDGHSPRLKCAMQLNGIGTAFALYQNDNRGDSNPFAGEAGSLNAGFGTGLYNRPGENKITRWVDPNFNDWANQSTVGASLYLLVKTQDLVPNMFLCPQDPGAREMHLEEAVDICRENDWSLPQFWEDLNDFSSMANLSYSYNDPWNALLDAAAPSGLVLLADKSNAYATPTGIRNVGAGPEPVANLDGNWHDDNANNPRHGNTKNHHSEGQNVAFTDTHVKWFTKPTVGIEQDNIYTY